VCRIISTVGARFNDSPHFVIEGDEYDTAFFDKRSKFLHYLPECAIVNNVEFDHADIFNHLDEIILAFQRMTLQVPRNGLALHQWRLRKLLAASKPSAPLRPRPWASGPDCDIHIVDHPGEGREHRVHAEWRAVRYPADDR